MVPKELRVPLEYLDTHNNSSFFGESYGKWKTDSHPDETGETIPLTPGGEMGGGGIHLEPEREQETSFGGKSQRIRLTEEYVERLYKRLSENYQLPEKKDIWTC